jgi:hypothetical protein
MRTLSRQHRVHPDRALCFATPLPQFVGWELFYARGTEAAGTNVARQNMAQVSLRCLFFAFSEWP